MLKMTIDNEEVLSNNDISIKEEILSPSSTILNNVYPKSWEQDKDYVSRFYYPKDYSKLNIQNFSVEPEEAGTTIQVNGNATLTDVDTTKESRVLRLLGQTSQNGTPTPSSPIPVNVVSGDNTIDICGKNLLNIDNWVKGRINNTTGNIEYASNVSSMVIGENNISFVVSQAWNSGIASDFIPISTGNYVFKYGHNREITIAIDTYDSQKTKIARIDAFTQTQTPTTRTFTISDSNVKFIRIHFEVNSANVEYIVSEMQLEKGSTATTYEPYIGNSYPIYLGVENLAQITATGSYNCTLSDGVFTSISYSGYGNIRPAITQITLPANKTIYYSADIRLKSGTSSGALNNMAIFGTTNTYTTNKLVNPTISSEFQRYIFSITPTIDEPAKGLLIQTNSGSSNAVIEIKNIMISYSYSNDFYEYGVTPIELCKIGNYQDYFAKSDGRNLFDNTYNDLGMWITNIGETTTFAQGSQYLGAYCKVEPGTYTISRNKKTNRFRIGVSPNQPTGTTSSCYVVASNDNASSITIDVPQGNNYICIYLSNNSETSTNVDLMIEKGSSASDYQPYGVGWYLHKEIGKVVLDGTQNITQATSGIRRFNATYTTLGLTNIKDGTGSYNSANYRMCDHFIHMDANHTSQLWGIYYLYNNWLVMFDTESVMADANALKTWLLSNPTTIYYVLATPTNTPIEDTTLIEQLEALSS